MERDLNALPKDVERFQSMRQQMVQDLKKARTTLLQIQTGAKDVQALDFLEGTSQAY